MKRILIIVVGAVMISFNSFGQIRENKSPVPTDSIANNSGILNNMAGSDSITNQNKPELTPGTNTPVINFSPNTPGVIPNSPNLIPNINPVMPDITPTLPSIPNPRNPSNTSPWMPAPVTPTVPSNPNSPVTPNTPETPNSH
jgi:hypothetical protein